MTHIMNALRYILRSSTIDESLAKIRSSSTKGNGFALSATVG
ncbi:hypothetical protein [Altererythrobacter sp.]|nr:hypothetical protein [Altererythrobacter sp.]